MADFPHVTWLRTFEVAARHSSFSAAAEELGMTPAAVSQQIRLLEQHLRTTLFERLPRGVKLTDMGQAYAQPVRQSFAGLQSATKDLFQRTRKRVVRVRASISFAGLVLAPRMAEFYDRHPDIDVQLSTFVWSDRFNDEAVDIDIRYGFGDWDDGVVIHLGYEYGIVVCNPNYATTFDQPVSIRDFAAAKVVRIVGSESDWSHLSEHFGLKLATTPDWFKADSSLTALQTVISGTGSVIVLESFARLYLEQGLLIAPFDYKLPVAASHFVVHSHKSFLRDDVQLFSTWVRGLVE